MGLEHELKLFVRQIFFLLVIDVIDTIHVHTILVTNTLLFEIV